MILFQVGMMLRKEYLSHSEHEPEDEEALFDPSHSDGERKARRPVNLTCFVVVALLICFFTWGVDQHLFSLESYDSVHEAYSGTGSSVLRIEVYKALSNPGKMGTLLKGKPVFSFSVSTF